MDNAIRRLEPAAGTAFRRLILQACLLLFATLMLFAATTVQAASLLFVTTSPVAPGKFRLLAELAAPHGLTVEARFVEKLAGKVDADFFRGYDMVIFDVPRAHMHEAVHARVAPALPALAASKTPALWLPTEMPTAQHLPDALARRLHAYYVNGGRGNAENFFATLAAHFRGQSWQQLPPPQIFPTTAIYHPKAPGLVFADTAAYLRWLGSAGKERPVIALAFHQQSIAAAQTGLIDDLIARIEAGGAVPLAFYSPVMDNAALRTLLSPQGKPIVDVLINTQITLNPEGRRSEFSELGIPVIQAMSYRKGDAAAWTRDPQGIALIDVPFYLAQAEYAGIHDIQIAAATDAASDQLLPIPAQAATVANKALALARLKHQSNGQKKVAIMFWNYPPGEKNLGASYMNLPTSFEATLAALKEAGYTTTTPDARTLTMLLQRLLRPFYRPGGERAEIEELLQDGLAELLPLAAYRNWLASLPAAQQSQWQAAVGAPEKSALVIRRNGQDYFAIPRLKLGNVTILPQPPRSEPGGDKEKALYHSTTALPSHFYMAAYLWLRKQFGADALVHFGTHGTQEWLPGKERGLSVHDWPLLALGDVPVIYPYIVDNIGEAVQTKRRGRAVNISHQTPPFAPAGLHDELTQLHDQLHAWLAQDDGAVKDKLRAQLTAGVTRQNIHRDMGWTSARIEADFRSFVDALHDHLHELAQMAQPLGLHTFGKGADEKWRLATVMMMLGRPFWEAAAGTKYGQPGDAREEVDEALIADYAKLTQTSPYLLLRRHVVDGAPTADLKPELRRMLEQGKRWYSDLAGGNETSALLAALDGRYIPTSYGGDPIKNPDALPTGRNLYGFDPSRVPTKAAWDAGKEAMEKLIAAHRAQSGAAPRKLAFTLWSVETMRHQGLLEAQALWAMGVEPVWDAGGRVVDVKLVPRAALGRPRVDVVLSATGLYRDHFPNVMKQLARAAQLAAQVEGESAEDNPIAENSRLIATTLVAQGWSMPAAQKAAQTRIFSGASGSYGSGLGDAALATDTWQDKADGDRKLAQLYLSKMQFAYGPDESDWGKSGAELQQAAGGRGDEGVNLYAAHLKGTQGAVLSRSSNLYGMLTTDDPFQYLGGIATAVRHLDGKAPELYISNLRGSGSGKVEGAASFLAKELATRNFHPGHIKGLMAEGYAGTLQILDSVNNFAGWTAVAREIVRDDQWQEFAEVYVQDKHRLGLNQWFERENPHALAQTIERMLEAARQGYWQADAAMLDTLKARYRDLAQRYDVRTDNSELQRYAGLPGYGLSQPVSPALQASRPAPANGMVPPPAQEQSQAPAPAPQTPQVQGVKLEPVTATPAHAFQNQVILALAILLLLPIVGAWRQWRITARRTA